MTQICVALPCRDIAMPLDRCRVASLLSDKGEVTEMNHQYITTLTALGAAIVVAAVALTAQSQDRFALKATYRAGIPANGNAVPDGAVLAKIEWLQDRDEKRYGVTVPGAQTEMSFMLKDSKRFPDTNE
jgi:hypothetical protein